MKERKWWVSFSPSRRKPRLPGNSNRLAGRSRKVKSRSLVGHSSASPGMTERSGRTGTAMSLGSRLRKFKLTLRRAPRFSGAGSKATKARLPPVTGWSPATLKRGATRRQTLNQETRKLKLTRKEAPCGRCAGNIANRGQSLERETAEPSGCPLLYPRLRPSLDRSPSAPAKSCWQGNRPVARARG